LTEVVSRVFFSAMIIQAMVPLQEK
jgi:hypothetical protein